LVRVNPVMLERVMFNLAANAIEAFDGIGPNRPGIKSTLTVSADLTQSAARPSLVIRFIDTGAGIPEDTRHDEIFELLKSGKSDGTGFGLYMVKVFVESWNGTIRATPNDINGQGTIIEMVLPVVGTV
jgi:signal transduction histidine kinase